jgi:hypothetical protein
MMISSSSTALSPCSAVRHRVPRTNMIAGLHHLLISDLPISTPEHPHPRRKSYSFDTMAVLGQVGGFGRFTALRKDPTHPICTDLPDRHAVHTVRRTRRIRVWLPQTSSHPNARTAARLLSSYPPEPNMRAHNRGEHMVRRDATQPRTLSQVAGAPGVRDV